MLFANYDTPFGQGGESTRAKVQAYVWAVEGKPLDLVERVVKDFVTGKVDRSASKRSKLPTSEEFAAQIRIREAESGEVQAMASSSYAPPAGPLWGVKVIAMLLKGPDKDMLRPSAFMAAEIAKGGVSGERYRLQHQANNGFRRVNLIFQAAADARGCLVEEKLHAHIALMEPVPVTGDVFAAWRDEFARRGWPWLPDMGKQRVVYLPKGGPAGFASIEAEL
ncbi:hypothetical protein D3Y55_15880 [Mesorhizobium sp. DCY119]|nr:hypothetical protein D3Y55_15880 [Mesorhizobium sp. DCY119]